MEGISFSLIYVVMLRAMREFSMTEIGWVLRLKVGCCSGEENMVELGSYALERVALLIPYIS